MHVPKTKRPKIFDEILFFREGVSPRRVWTVGKGGESDWIRTRTRKCNNEERVLLTGYAEIVRLAKRRSLRLELCLDNVKRTGGDTRGESTACTSCEGLIGERLEVGGGILSGWADLSCC